MRIKVVDHLGPGVSLAQHSQRSLDRVVELAVSACRIPAPSGSETERAGFVAERLRERGYAPEFGPEGNVYARRRGSGEGLVIVSAHLDTVFPVDTPLRVQRSAGRLQCPGIGDNSLGIAAAIGLVDILDEAGIDTYPDILLVADVGEEGLGNLRGMRAAISKFQDETCAVIAIEGHNLGRITNVAVGSRRWRIDVTGSGGHSWGAHGQPSAIHELCAMVTRWCDIRLPGEPRTTFNVGSIQGGTSVNTIAAEAHVVLDMRSTDPSTLEALAERVRAIAMDAERDRMEVAIEVLGERPAGSIPPGHPLVVAAREAGREARLRTVLDESSTSANVPLAQGIPAICIGITTGGRGHSLDEYIDVAPIAQGMHQLAALVQRVSGQVRDGVLRAGARA